MSWITDLVGGAIKPIGDIIDEYIETDEEKTAAKNKMILALEAIKSEAQKEVTTRWKADMESDNILSKNVRPGTLIFLTLVFCIIAFADGNIGQFTIRPAYVPVFETLLMVVYGAYFAGRTIQHVKRKKQS